MERGFTLVELLVALAILAVAAAGLVRATEAHIDTTRGLERRTVARWIAHDRLAEIGLRPGAALPAEVEMMGGRWRVATQTRPTADPEIARATISVSAAGDRAPAATLTGFVDTGLAR